MKKGTVCYVAGLEGQCKLVYLGLHGASSTVIHESGETYNVPMNQIRFDIAAPTRAPSTHYVPPKRPDIVKLEEEAKRTNEQLERLRNMGRLPDARDGEKRKDEAAPDENGRAPDTKREGRDDKS